MDRSMLSIFFTYISAKTAILYSKDQKYHVTYPLKDDFNEIVRISNTFEDGPAEFFFAKSDVPGEFRIKYAEQPDLVLSSVEMGNNTNKQVKTTLRRKAYAPNAKNQLFKLEKINDFYKIINNGFCATWDIVDMYITFERCNGTDKQIFDFKVELEEDKELIRDD